eukprot:scaffold210494_cov43-Prasinocladus_malaysianus.AAC.1
MRTRMKNTTTPSTRGPSRSHQESLWPAQSLAKRPSGLRLGGPMQIETRSRCRRVAPAASGESQGVTAATVTAAQAVMS